MKLDPAMERGRVEAVKAWRLNRGAAAAQDAVRALVDGARGGANLVPLVVEAVARRCTLGEVSDALRGVFGEHRETVVL
jgi:methylmalonyl-CoA mutase N-terminal domain/subunit